MRQSENQIEVGWIGVSKHLHVKVEKANLARIPKIGRVLFGPSTLVGKIHFFEQIRVPFSINVPARMTNMSEGTCCMSDLRKCQSEGLPMLHCVGDIRSLDQMLNDNGGFAMNGGGGTF